MGPTNKLWFNPQLHQSNFCGVFCRLDSPVLVESRNFFDSKFDSGWWFGTMFIFPYIGNNHPNWLSYFSEGLKPPTRIWFHVWVRSIPLVAGFQAWSPLVVGSITSQGVLMTFLRCFLGHPDISVGYPHVCWWNPYVFDHYIITWFVKSPCFSPIVFPCHGLNLKLKWHVLLNLMLSYINPHVCWWNSHVKTTSVNFSHRLNDIFSSLFLQDPILLAGPGMKVGYFLQWAPLLGAKRWVQMGPLWWLNGRIFSGTFLQGFGTGFLRTWISPRWL